MYYEEDHHGGQGMEEEYYEPVPQDQFAVYDKEEYPEEEVHAYGDSESIKSSIEGLCPSWRQ